VSHVTNCADCIFQAKIVLDTLVCMFSQYCVCKYTAECCEVVLPDGTVTRYPELAYREEVVNVQKTNRYVGIRWMTFLFYCCCSYFKIILAVLTLLHGSMNIVLLVAGQHDCIAPS